jgi:hypothetical protein
MCLNVDPVVARIVQRYKPKPFCILLALLNSLHCAHDALKFPVFLVWIVGRWIGVHEDHVPQNFPLPTLPTISS